MPTRNIYIPANAEHLFKQLEHILKERHQSLSEFFISHVRFVVENEERMGEWLEIVLVSPLEKPRLTRKFEGKWVFWEEDDTQVPHTLTGVSVTKRGKLAYWFDSQGGIDEPNKFLIFDSLAELSDAGLLNEHQLRQVAAGLDVAGLDEEIVQKLDI